MVEVDFSARTLLTHLQNDYGWCENDTRPLRMAFGVGFVNDWYFGIGIIYLKYETDVA